MPFSNRVMPAAAARASFRSVVVPQDAMFKRSSLSGRPGGAGICRSSSPAGYLPGAASCHLGGKVTATPRALLRATSGGQVTRVFVRCAASAAWAGRATPAVAVASTVMASRAGISARATVILRLPLVVRTTCCIR